MLAYTVCKNWRTQRTQNLSTCALIGIKSDCSSLLLVLSSKFHLLHTFGHYLRVSLAQAKVKLGLKNIDLSLSQTTLSSFRALFNFHLFCELFFEFALRVSKVSQQWLLVSFLRYVVAYAWSIHGRLEHIRTTPSNLGGELTGSLQLQSPSFPKAMMKLAAVAVLSALTALWQILFWYEVTRSNQNLLLWYPDFGINS